MSSDKKPVYIPRQKRLHGAFRGGFSAGYFNTVGSREGWTPRQPQEEDVQQRPEDFMDEQDHNEWGGPSAVHAAFQLNEKKDKPPTLAALLTGALVPPANIGRQLLRALGWRESSSSAFVPSAHNTFDSGNQEEHVYLSARRLRKIQLNQKKVEIPQPKLDTAGLGFERFANAPEFQRDREKRRKLQANRRKVYRVADVVAGSSKEPSASNPTNEDDGEPYVSFETENDFVGTKSVGGFALHEDEDDAYDDEEDLGKVTGKVNIDQDNYDTVAYEHQFSSDEEKEISFEKKAHNSKGIATVLGSVLSAWASASAPEGGTKKLVLTTDGRPVLSGFVLGGTDSSFCSSQRFPGPDLPDGYEVEPHVFSAEDHPLVIQALSHAEKLTASAEQKKAIVENALKSNETANKPSRLHQKGVFEGLRTTMSSRFVTSSATMEPPNVPVAGLSTASEYEASQTLTGQPETTVKLNSSKKLSITRTASLFVPEPLLCKRFNIPVPEHMGLTLTAKKAETRTREEAYFQDEILAKVKVAPPNERAVIAGEEKKLETDVFGETARPSMDVYKAIYNVYDSPEVSENEDIENDGGGGTFANVDKSGMDVATRETVSTIEEKIVPYRERKRSRAEQRSPSSSEVSSSDQSDNERRRKKDKKSKKERKKQKREDRKRRKKHKKSSKRKRDRGKHDD